MGPSGRHQSCSLVGIAHGNDLGEGGHVTRSQEIELSVWAFRPLPLIVQLGCRTSLLDRGGTSDSRAASPCTSD